MVITTINFSERFDKNYFDKSFLLITSDSMGPNIKKGSVVITKINHQLYRIGDVIVFNYPYNLQRNIAHRIIRIDKEGYITRGDANNTDDPWLVTDDIIVGKVFFDIPYLGYPILFLRSKIGLFIGFLVPLVVLMLMEVEIVVEEGRQLLKLSTRRLRPIYKRLQFKLNSVK